MSTTSTSISSPGMFQDERQRIREVNITDALDHLFGKGHGLIVTHVTTNHCDTVNKGIVCIYDGTAVLRVEAHPDRSYWNEHPPQVFTIYREELTPASALRMLEDAVIDAHQRYYTKHGHAYGDPCSHMKFMFVLRKHM